MWIMKIITEEIYEDAEPYASQVLFCGPTL